MAGGVCRAGDQVEGTCNAYHAPDGHSRQFIGTWTGGSTACIDASTGKGIIRTTSSGDIGTTDCAEGHHFVCDVGSTLVQNGGIGVVRVGDTVRIVETGGGTGICTTGMAGCTAL